MAADEEQLSWFRAGVHYHAMTTILCVAQAMMKEVSFDDTIKRMQDGHEAVDKMDAEAIAKDLLEYSMYEGKRIPFEDQELLANLAKTIVMVWVE